MTGFGLDCFRWQRLLTTRQRRDGIESAGIQQFDLSEIPEFMNQSPRFQTACLTCLFIAAAGLSFPSAAEADDATNADAPATVTAPVTAVAPEATNSPAPDITNSPAATGASVDTNAPAPAAALAVTNTPAAGTPPPTNAPAAVVAPVTETPAAAKPAATVPLVKATRPTASDQTTEASYQPFNLGIEAGTTGVGGGAGWRFADHLSLVGGMDYLKFSLNKTYSGVPYSGDVRMQSEYAGINLYPWQNSSFHVSLGAYFNQNQFTGTAVSDGTLVINGVTVPPTDSVSLNYKQQPVDPYVSIGGNLYFDKAHHFSLGAELGAFYLGNPRVSVSTTAPPGVVTPADLAAYQQQVENDIKKLPVWPILKLSLNYSF